MKCKHANFTIYEHVSASTSYAFKDGNPPEHGWGSEPVPTGEITVCCDDCEFEKKYRHSHAPKWIQDAWERLMEEQA